MRKLILTSTLLAMLILPSIASAGPYNSVCLHGNSGLSGMPNPTLYIAVGWTPGGTIRLHALSICKTLDMATCVSDNPDVYQLQSPTPQPLKQGFQNFHSTADWTVVYEAWLGFTITIFGREIFTPLSESISGVRQLCTENGVVPVLVPV